MTTPAAEPTSKSVTPTPTGRSAFWIAQILVIIPIWVAAYRDGHGGWFPTMDAATTVLRARDTFTGNFPFIGMWSSVSDKLGTATYFPGATELYLLAIPNQIFGYTWGTLIGMAMINTLWLFVAGWLLRRRVGTVGAIWGLGVFGLLLWTMGSEALIDVAPMQMITIPFAVFLVAVWSVADRDLGAMPVLAFLASFLLLDHLVLTLLVPTIGLCAVVGLFVTMRAHRRKHPDMWPAERRYLIRQLAISVGLTVVLWTPTLIQQFTNSPGNLTNLYNASKVDLLRSLTPSHAFDVVVRMLAVPPFWLRDTFDSARGSQPIDTAAIIIGIAIVLGVIGLGVAAVRRGDQVVVTALAVAVVAAVVSIVNILSAPTDYGFRRNYFRSLWGMAMFFWMAVGLALVRAVVPHEAFQRHRNHVTGIGLAGVLVISAAATPYKNPGPGTNGTSGTTVELANEIMNHTVVLLNEMGQVEVSSGGDFTSFGFASTLILAAENYGVDVCVPHSMVAQYGKHRACRPGGADTHVRVSSTAFPPFPGERVLTEASLLTKAEQKEKAALATEVATWLSEQDRVEVNPRVQQILVDAYGEAGAEKFKRAVFDTRGLPLSSLVFSQSFVQFVTDRSIWKSDGSVDSAVKTGSFPAEDLVRWADLTWREFTGESVRVAVIPASVAKVTNRTTQAESGESRVR